MLLGIVSFEVGLKDVSLWTEGTGEWHSRLVSVGLARVPEHVNLVFVDFATCVTSEARPVGVVHSQMLL